MPFDESLLGPEEVEAPSGFDESLLGPEEDPKVSKIAALRAELSRTRDERSNADTRLGALSDYVVGPVANIFNTAANLPFLASRAVGLVPPEQEPPMAPGESFVAPELLSAPAETALERLGYIRPENAGPSVARGVIRGGSHLVSGLATPENIPFLGVGAVRPALQAATGAGFSALMASQLPQATEQFAESTVEGTPQDIAESATTLAGLFAMTGAPVVLPPAIKAIGERRIQRAENKRFDRASTEAAQDSALQFTDPSFGRDVNRALPEVVETSTPELVGSVGPGAASPAELNARRQAAVRGVPPPNSTPPVVVEAGSPVPPGKPSIAVGRKPSDFSIINRINSPQFTYWFGKLGQFARAAWERIALGEFTIREGAGRDMSIYVEGLLQSLPRPLRKQGGKAFFDVLDGKTVEQVRAEWEGKPNGDKVIAATEQVRGRLEEIRTTIRDTKRDSYSAYLLSLDKQTLTELWKKNIGETVDVSAYTKEQLSDGLARNQFADDWGIADGSYLPHLFMGQWKVTAKLPGSSEATFAFRAKTPAEAQARIFKAAKDNPDLANAQWSIDADTVIPGDAVRLGDRNFWRLVGEMKRQALEGVNVKEAMTGIMGRKASRQKWFGSLQQRQGFRGYERDYRRVMNAYLSGFHRWKELTAVNREVQPMIDNVRAEGRQETARQLDDLLEYVWGKPSSTTIQFDNLINRIPVLRDYIKPLALDRWSRNIRSVASFMTLTTVRFAVVNRLQPLQGLLPLLNEASLIRAKVLQHSVEGRALLDKSGVRFDPGQFTERGIGGRISGVRERITGERSNQELAFLAMYEHGISKGMSPEAATKYAKLRGQLMTQFTPLMSDTPVAMRDPVMAVVFQFKRFPIKQVELLTRLAADRNAPGIARWAAGMAAMGGLNYAFRQLWSSDDKRKRLRDAIAKDHGTTVADGVMYGLPGLVGADISGSMVLGDEPFGANIYEKVGRSVTGPAVSLAANTASAIQTARRFPGTPAEATADALRRYPTTRPLAELHSLATGNYDIRSPDGEAKYRRTLKEVLLGLGSFRSASESNMRAAIDAAVSLQKESSDLKNALWVKELSGSGAESEVKAIADFNARWPEFAITNEEWRNYKSQRKAGLDKTDVERRVGKKYAPLLAPSP